MYDITPPGDENEYLESMNNHTLLLFDIIKSQLFDQENPIYVVSTQFTIEFLNSFKNCIIYDDNTNDHYFISENGYCNYDIIYMNENQRQKYDAYEDDELSDIASRDYKTCRDPS